MKTVQVLLSSYNGEKYIERQLDSIFGQKNVNLSCLIRDDGSNDRTVAIIKEYQKKEPRLKLIESNNIGWRKSFLKLLLESDSADYYAFSDQDDEWFDNKLVEGVTTLEMHDGKIPLLFHSARIRKDSNGEHLQQMLPKPKSKINALVQEYCQGCSIIINKRARDILNEYDASGEPGFDFWVGLICYYFGEIYYCNKPLFYHINHLDNTTRTGDRRACMQVRWKNMLAGKKVYNNPCKELLDGYSNYMSETDRKNVEKVLNYNKGIKGRLELLLNPEFVRNTKSGTLLLKMCVLMGKY